MKKKKLKIALFTSAIIFLPTIVLATRGADDYGIAGVVIFMLFTFPFGLTMLGFIIYLYITLKSTVKPAKNKGRIVFVLSLILLVLSILISLAIMSSEDWHPTMVGIVLGNFVPIVLLSTISVVLTRMIKRRANSIT